MKDPRTEKQPPRKQPTDDAVQGEGDYESARRYDHDVEEFVAHTDVEAAARAAAPRSEAEAREMAEAETAGRRGKVSGTGAGHPSPRKP